jgi:hypothetical protein
MVFILITAVSGIRLTTSLLVSYCVQWPTGCCTLPLTTLHQLLEPAVAIRLKKEPRSCPRTLFIALGHFKNSWYRRWKQDSHAARHSCCDARALLEDRALEEFGDLFVHRSLNWLPRTSKFMAADSDKTTIIFRRFDELAVRNLLYLEARVAALDEVLISMDKEDSKLRSKSNTWSLQQDLRRNLLC